MQLFAHFRPLSAKKRANTKDPSYEELAIPRRLAEYSVDLRNLGGFQKPNHPMVNYVSKELAIGKLKIPIYTPYIAPD